MINPTLVTVLIFWCVSFHTYAYIGTHTHYAYIGRVSTLGQSY